MTDKMVISHTIFVKYIYLYIFVWKIIKINYFSTSKILSGRINVVLFIHIYIAQTRLLNVTKQS